MKRQKWRFIWYSNFKPPFHILLKQSETTHCLV